ncbi:MAG: hypothetical protein ACRELF_17255 [Gemmataceae bacterium]
MGENARKGFFELEELQAKCANLWSEFQGFGDFGYAIGWRIMKILPLRWAQVDFQSGMLRLEPGSTKTGAGRVLPSHTAARSVERAGVRRSAAMALGGWRSESMYRRYAIASEGDVRDGVSRLASFRKTVARVHQ